MNNGNKGMIQIAASILLLVIGLLWAAATYMDKRRDRTDARLELLIDNTKNEKEILDLSESINKRSQEEMKKELEDNLEKFMQSEMGEKIEL